MSDLNDLNKPDLQSAYANGDVPDTLLGHIKRLWTGDYVGMQNLVPNMLRWSITGTSTLSARLYRRNIAGTDVEVTSLPGMSIGGNAATATTTGRGGGNVSTNLANGANALLSNTSGIRNTANGNAALYSNTSSSNNTANGNAALYSNTGGDSNTANGYAALYSNTIGSNNTANGTNALFSNTTGDSNTGNGKNALFSNVTFSNCSGFGANSAVTGSNQVQLGDSQTTTYVYGTVQNRSDLRDKTDVRDTVLGLEFINALRPVDYRLDMRDDYRQPIPPQLAEDATDSEKTAHKQAMEDWLSASKLSNVVRDGTKKRSRFHHGFIAQEVKETLDRLDIDFGGYQDHLVNGGDDVKSLGYDEFIAPLIKAVQQLSQQNKDLNSRLSKLELRS